MTTTPDTRLTSAPTTADVVPDDSCFSGWYVCTERSFSFSQPLHFHKTASLQSGQYSAGDISLPQALHSIACLSTGSLLNVLPMQTLYAPAA